jgi:hypothetical protein
MQSPLAQTPNPEAPNEVNVGRPPDALAAGPSRTEAVRTA